jgi:drug/metabolite transporter (DMT)-like permease
MIVFLVAIGAAVAIGLGYVLQQRVAARATRYQLLSLRLFTHLMHMPMWWLGVACIAAGQVLGGWALQLSSVAVVEPLLSISLLVAFIFAAGLARHAPRWQEVLGTLLLSAALAVFLAVSGPQPATRLHSDWVRVFAGAAAVAAVTGVLVAVARRRRQTVESVLLAAAAGVLYGLQDVGTRGGFLVLDANSVPSLLRSPWPYVVLGTAVCGIFLSQNAFRAARLDYSLPPSTATEPVVAIALGAGILGERLSVSAVDLLLDSLCVVALVGGVVLIGRSPALEKMSRDLPGRRPASRAAT